MDLSPQSTRSPQSLSVHPSESHLCYEYPSPAHSDSDRVQRATTYELGNYQHSMNQNNSQHDAMPLLPSSATSQWPTAAFHATGNLYPSSSIPDRYLAGFDPFIPSCSHEQSSNEPHVLSMQSRERGTSTPFGSCDNSQRSSFSSTAPSETFSFVESTLALHPQVKMEESSRPLIGSEHLPVGSYSQQDLEGQGEALNSYRGDIGSDYRSDAFQAAWLRMDGNQESPTSSGRRPHHGRAMSFDSISIQAKAARRSHDDGASVRQQRRLTSKEDANFQCAVTGCGKLFSRSYNYKAHMETHDTGRVYPFPCLIGDCNKKFVRKTDLQRHHQSVHEKQRNHQCDFCNRFFARKDTLRRYEGRSCLKGVSS